ncbi:uncharacterized protein LOC132034941 [Lycium ferocissimum]|uniref:uncharacterized protein LOC132034941 n=1 Tax=Lycium ferocissimum TaxID=112874 RepID=UPI0028152A21|nr:uncharacterized protein LOC132034941 [Lycium ferocissimum]
MKKWFPPSKKAELRDKIFEFKQLPGEQLYSAWERFKYYLAQSPTHGFPDAILTEKFYKGLDTMNQIAVNTAAGGCFMDKSFVNITRLLDKLTTHNQAWHSTDNESLSYGSPSLAAVAKENHERDHAFAQLQTTVDLLSKKLAEKDALGVNAVEELPPPPQGMYQVPEGMYQDGNDQGNPNQGNYNNNNYGNKSSNPYIPPRGQASNFKQWRDNSASNSASNAANDSAELKSMMQKMLMNQDRTESTIKGMSQVQLSHSAAIQKLESQFRDLSREVHTPQRGQLPSDTVPNPKGADKKVIDLEPIVEEEAQPDVSDVIVEEETEEKVPIIAEEEQNLENFKAQGEKHEKGKAKLSGALRPLTQLFKSSPPFPQRLVRKTEDDKCLRFYDQLKQLTMNISFMDAVQEMPGFAKYLKDLLTKKKKPLKHDTVGITHRVSAIISKTTVQKREDRGAFTIPCTIGQQDF